MDLTKVRSAKSVDIGDVWPERAHTMVGRKRLNNVRDAVLDVLAKGVPGDLIETGVWRGGTTIFMKGLLTAAGDDKRKVYVCDSFEGLPPPSGKYKADKNSIFHTYDALRISKEQVQRNFQAYNLLDDNVEFVKGFFSDTMPTLKNRIDKLAVLRLDGDMYQSNIVVLEALYDKLSDGGYVIIDDYGCCPGARKATDDFRAAQGITDELKKIDWSGVYWQKTSIMGAKREGRRLMAWPTDPLADSDLVTPPTTPMQDRYIGLLREALLDGIYQDYECGNQAASAREGWHKDFTAVKKHRKHQSPSEPTLPGLINMVR